VKNNHPCLSSQSNGHRLLCIFIFISSTSYTFTFKIVSWLLEGRWKSYKVRNFTVSNKVPIGQTKMPRASALASQPGSGVRFRRLRKAVLPKPYFHSADLIQPSKWSAFVRFFFYKGLNQNGLLADFPPIWQHWERRESRKDSLTRLVKYSTLNLKTRVKLRKTCTCIRF
jgi:hypothetical protein